MFRQHKWSADFFLNASHASVELLRACDLGFQDVPQKLRVTLFLVEPSQRGRMSKVECRLQ